MRRWVRFGVRKPVPVNLLMLAVIVGGAVIGLTLRRAFFPEQTPDTALVTLPYPGASPRQIEQTLAVKVEDALSELDEVDTLTTTVHQGVGVIAVKFREGENPNRSLDEVQRAIDALTDLPQDAEKIRTRLLKVRLPVIRATVYGSASELERKRAVRGIRDDLRSLPGMGEVRLDGVRRAQIRVDIDPAALVRQGVSLPKVARAIRHWLANVPGGTVKSESGDIKVRTLGVARRAPAIGRIVVRADPEGGVVRVEDVGQVHEGFTDTTMVTRFNGQPSAFVTVFKIGDQDIVNMARMVKAYVAGRQGRAYHAGLWARVTGSDAMAAYRLGLGSAHPLPPGAKLALSSDLSRFVQERLSLLARNAIYGAALVFATLLLVLNWRAALWVGAGLVTAIFGTLLLMAGLNISLNLLTMFGLIVVLGLLVDDAIVVAENIQTMHERGRPALRAAVDGTMQVFWPVVATVLTTVVAFAPLGFIRGQIGELLGSLPVVVAGSLMMSLLEALLILPSHMGHTLARRDRARPKAGSRASRVGRRVHRLEAARDRWITGRLVPAYGALERKLLGRRYLTLTGAGAVLIVSVAMVVGGRLVFDFLPDSDSETVMAQLRMPVGTPVGRTDEAVAQVERAARAQPEVRSVASTIGTHADIDTGQTQPAAPNVAQFFLELTPVQDRARDASHVIASIRGALAGKLEQAQRLDFTLITGGPAGPDISVQVRGGDPARLGAAAKDMKALLGRYAGVYDIADDNDRGQREVRVHPRPGAATLGFTAEGLARQLRGALYGIDAHVFARRREDVKVRVRLARPTRRSITAVEKSWVISPAGLAVPLPEVASLEQATTYATIHRVDRRRTVTVTAAIDPAISPERITAALTAPSADGGPSPIARFKASHHFVRVRFAGRQKQMREAFASLPYGFAAALVMIYVILAWLFESYLQPLVVLSVIPFSIIGVVWGHLLMGYELTFLSLIGFVALMGIVVNDSLILVEFYNHHRESHGSPPLEALVAAGQARLRAIMLTTVTTVCGLLPLILARSFQAKFMIPMAIAIAGGLLASTLVVLIVLPCLMLVLEDLRAAAHHAWHGKPRSDGGH